MNILIELLMYFFVIIGMMTVITCIFEKQICSYLSNKYSEKEDRLGKEIIVEEKIVHKVQTKS